MTRRRKKRNDTSVSETLRQAITESDIPLLVLERETGVKRQSIMRFVRGERTLRLDIADLLAAYFGLELVQYEEKDMSRNAETQDDRIAKVKRILKGKPGVAFNSQEIKHETGVSKGRIDFELSLSSDPQIERTEARVKDGVPIGVRWTYIGPA